MKSITLIITLWSQFSSIMLSVGKPSICWRMAWAIAGTNVNGFRSKSSHRTSANCSGVIKLSETEVHSHCSLKGLYPHLSFECLASVQKSSWHGNTDWIRFHLSQSRWWPSEETYTLKWNPNHATVFPTFKSFDFVGVWGRKAMQNYLIWNKTSGTWFQHFIPQLPGTQKV